jgi:hypothetical protein
MVVWNARPGAPWWIAVVFVASIGACATLRCGGDVSPAEGAEQNGDVSLEERAYGVADRAPIGAAEEFEVVGEPSVLMRAGAVLRHFNASRRAEEQHRGLPSRRVGKPGAVTRRPYHERAWDVPRAWDAGAHACPARLDGWAARRASHLDARRPDATGTISCVVRADRRDAYFALHPGSDFSAAYHCTEFEVLPPDDEAASAPRRAA